VQERKVISVGPQSADTIHIYISQDWVRVPGRKTPGHGLNEMHDVFLRLGTQAASASSFCHISLSFKTQDHISILGGTEDKDGRTDVWLLFKFHMALLLTPHWLGHSHVTCAQGRLGGVLTE
jgi:hypothetical protein